MSGSFIYDAIRTPFGRYGKALAGIRPDDLAAHVLRSLAERHPEYDTGEIDDVILGDANGAGEDNRNVARMAALLAGFPTSIPGATSTGCAVQASRQSSRPAGRSSPVTPN